MQEQQGNLEEPLSGLPGPRPFNKNNKKGVPMESSNNKELNDIVARATEALSSGKAFGGWTDAVEEQRVKQGKPIKVKLGKDKSGTMSGLMTPKQKGTKVGVLSHVEHDGEYLDEASADAKPKLTSSELKMARYRAKWKPRNLKKSAESSGMSGTIRAGVEYDDVEGVELDEKIATQPRQLKDKKKEVLVHDSKGKVTTIDKKDLEQYQKDNPGSGVAEGVSRIGISVREGAKGAAAGAALGSIIPGIGTVVGGLLGYALGDAGAAVTGIGKKKKTWQDK